MRWGQELHSGRPAKTAMGKTAEMSYTVTSRETVLTVSTRIGSKCRLLFGKIPKPLKFSTERTDVMNESKNKNLFIRVSEKEKSLIERNAEKFGLSVSEYLRQRALGYMPRAALPEMFSLSAISWTNSALLPMVKYRRIRKQKLSHSLTVLPKN